MSRFLLLIFVYTVRTIFKIFQPFLYSPLPRSADSDLPPTDSASGLRPTTLQDDASKISSEPGSYEWWNFFASEQGGYDQDNLSISMIFNPADLFNADYRRAVFRWRSNPERYPVPDPFEYSLLQLNVTVGSRKLFTRIKNPKGTVTEFSKERPYGKFTSGDNECSFNGYLDENGIKTYEVKINQWDMLRLKRLEANIIFRERSSGFTIDGQGMYGRIPGGAGLHHWQSSLGYPETEGTVIIHRPGPLPDFKRRFKGGTGLADHMWGQGLCGDMLHSWYFGKIELDENGTLVYVYLTPAKNVKNAEPYGHVFLIPGHGGLPGVFEIVSMDMSGKRTGRFRLDYYSRLKMGLPDNGKIDVKFGDPAVEDWPFQVVGPSVVSIDIPGKITREKIPGIGEYLQQDKIDDPVFRVLYAMLNLAPSL